MSSIEHGSKITVHIIVNKSNQPIYLYLINSYLNDKSRGETVYIANYLLVYLPL